MKKFYEKPSIEMVVFEVQESICDIPSIQEGLDDDSGLAPIS